MVTRVVLITGLVLLILLLAVARWMTDAFRGCVRLVA